MKCNWAVVRLGDICTTNKSTYSPKDDWQFVNYLDTGNITANKIDDIQHIDIKTEKLPSRAKRKVNYNNIIYSTVRPNQRHYGIIKEQPENFLVSTGFTVIEVDPDKVDADYLYFLLSSDSITESLSAIAEQSTSAYPSIKPSDIENLEILLPTLSEQKQIACILKVLDDKIALNQQINKNLEEQAQAIYKAWFMDFEPFDGEMPSDWTYRTLGDIATVSSGKRPPMKSDVKTKETHIPIVGASSVMGFTNEANHSDKILVIGRVGTHGIVQRFNRPCWTSDNTLVLTSQHYEYVYQILRTIDYASLNRGSTQPLITQSDIKKLEILLPTESIARNFEGIVEDLMLLHEENISENEKLSNLRDALLPRLMSGEIDVSGIEV